MRRTASVPLVGVVFFVAVLASGAWARAAAADAPAHPEPARTGGWSWKLPPDLVTPASEKRNHVFYVGEPVTFALGGAAASYEVRDYFGDLVDRGPAGEKVTLQVSRPGWYKLYVYGKDVRPEWGDVVGGTTFVIFRNTPNFPPLPLKDTPGGWHPAKDLIMRGVAAIGPHRHRGIDANKPDDTIQRLTQDLEIEKKYYLPFDPVRGRPLMVAFPGGTRGAEEGVRKIVAHFKDTIQYWEPRNEPNFGASAADFVRNELIPFYKAVKAANPAAKVMGPGTVSIGPQLLPWLEEFFKAGGGKYIDVFSFHNYNGINGDPWLARRSMDSLKDLLGRHGVGGIEKWQTEQGYWAAAFGVFHPRIQGRWTLLHMMLFEQYGIPKEHNNLWYDKSHGFWDFPSWWENEDGSLDPAAALVRVWSEELYGTTFARAFDFGPDGNKLYLGNLFTGPGKSVAAFMNVGSGVGQLALKVKGGDHLHIVSAFGVESDVPVRGGVATLVVPEIPVYVELAPGQTVEAVPIVWGKNLARDPGVTLKASGTGKHPFFPESPNEISRLNNGEYENWYWGQQPGDRPWMDNTEKPPAWVEIQLPAPTAVGRVVVFSAVPWQFDGTLVDYELQHDRDGRWVTLEHVREPPRTIGVFTPPTRTTVDSFFADRWVFEHRFTPVTTRKLRLLVHQATWGVGASRIVGEAGIFVIKGERNFMVLREVEVYGPEPGPAAP